MGKQSVRLPLDKLHLPQDPELSKSKGGFMGFMDTLHNELGLQSCSPGTW